MTFSLTYDTQVVQFCSALDTSDITGEIEDWLANDGQGLSRADAATLGLRLMQSLADGRFEQAAAQCHEEDYLVRPDLLGNSMFQTELAQETNMQPASPFELVREHVLQFSLFLGVCGGFRIR